MKRPKRNRFESYEGDVVEMSPHMGKAFWDLLDAETRQRLESLGWKDGIHPNPEYSPGFAQGLIKAKESLEKFEWDLLPEEIKKELAAAGFKDGLCPKDQKARQKK